jgi:purine-cytosine permease-like protein
VLLLIAVLLVLSAIHGYRFSSSVEPWAIPPSAA